jgi:hypothetical protein
MLEIVDELADNGPTADELGSEAAAFRRQWEHPDARLGYVFETAFDTLLGVPMFDPEEQAAKRAAVTPEVGREIALAATSEIIWFGNGENPAPARLHELPEWSTDEVTGDMYAPAGRHLRLSPTERLTVRYQDMIASVHRGETRRLHGPDAVTISIDAADWRDGARILERIDADTPRQALVCGDHAPGGLTDPEGRT